MLRKYLTYIRDYAYLLEKKQTGGIGKVRYKDKVLVIFGIYYFLIVGIILYTVRSFYYLPLKNIQNSDLFTKLIWGILFFYIPFEIFFYILNRYIVSSPLPVAGVDNETYRNIKRIYWTTAVIGICLAALFVLFVKMMGYVGDGPIFK